MATFTQLRYLLIATDPVHIGTGGYRLGRVDNSIVREPSTRLPKIPGTSLHGAIRAYAARVYENPDAAGQDHTHAKPNECPVCYTFGYITTKGDPAKGDAEAVGYSGVVSIFDAQILFFPIHTMAGPMWVTTFPLLKAAGFTVSATDEPATGKAKLTFARIPEINLGWLMVKPEGTVTVTAPKKWQTEAQWTAIASRIVIVSNAMFPQIVNSNLEVRTSVSINPATGAAKDGALFTFEALPRGVFLTMEAVVDDYRTPKEKEAAFKLAADGKTKKETPLPGGAWTEPQQVMEAGLKALAWLGVGGMGTRGFGRLAQVGVSIETPYAGGAQ
jgi:CRISPR-associated protein Cmr4